jgi:hypothetical protein
MGTKEAPIIFEGRLSHIEEDDDSHVGPRHFVCKAIERRHSQVRLTR